MSRYLIFLQKEHYPNSFTKIFDELQTVDEVRDLIAKDSWDLWGEYPRGSSRFDSLLIGINTCKHRHLMEQDLICLYESWYSRSTS